MTQRKADPLDEVAATWESVSPPIRKRLRSLSIRGKTGSGKASVSGAMLSSAVFDSGDTNGLITAAKPVDSKLRQAVLTRGDANDRSSNEAADDVIEP